jgi:muramoyltetrapeptide carboxypeptidase LdcA involved in peptidoglycan recycling
VHYGGRILARFTGPAARQTAEQFADNLESAAQEVQAAFEQNREKILSSLRGGQSVTR